MRERIPRVRIACSSRTAAAVATIIIPIAAAGAMSPASSIFRIATEASAVSGEYRNTTADTVVQSELERLFDEDATL